MLRFHLVSLFPEFFRTPLETALLGRAREAGIVDFSFHDPRSFSTSRHHHVDDRPYGGGPGMVMQGEPVAAALRSIEKPGRMILLAPSGRPLNDALARELAREEDLTLICGRYEGLDARLLDIFPLEPVSVGEAVLNGGETAALAVIESVARLVPGFMGKEESGDDESFSNGLLEYPHYTRPEVLEGREVPEVLRGGDHGAVARWRRQQSLATTLRVRPDLLDSAPLVAEDARHLATLPRTRAGRNLSFCLVHYPVLLGRRFLFDKFGYSRYSPDFPQLCDGTVLCRDPAGGPAASATGHSPALDARRGKQGQPGPGPGARHGLSCRIRGCRCGTSHGAHGHAAQSGGKFRLLARSQARAPAALSGGCVPHVRRRSCAAVAGYGPGAGP